MIEAVSVGDELRGVDSAAELEPVTRPPDDLHPSDVADLIIALPREEEGFVFRVLPRDEAGEVFSYLPPDPPGRADRIALATSRSVTCSRR